MGDMEQAAERLERDLDAAQAARPDTPDTPDEAAIVQHMRESGTLPQWETDPPAPTPAPPLMTRLHLLCGVSLWADRSIAGWVLRGIVLPSLVERRPDWSAFLRETPREILGHLESAVAELRQLVGGAEV